MIEEKIILNTSDEAAKFVENISGWVSRNGFFYGKDERVARFAGCTHVECQDCKAPAPKGRLVCGKCGEKRDIERYEKREKADWDGISMLYSDASDIYFSSWDEVLDHTEESDTSVEDLRLIICEPVFLRQIDDDYWCDDLTEDGELPKHIIEALVEFNKILSDHGPVSWMP